MLKQLLCVDIRLKLYRLCFVNEENDADLQIWHEAGERFLQVLQIIPGCGNPDFLHRTCKEIGLHCSAKSSYVCIRNSSNTNTMHASKIFFYTINIYIFRPLL